MIILEHKKLFTYHDGFLFLVILEHKKLFTNHDGFLFLVEPLLWFSVLKGSVENKQKMYAKTLKIVVFEFGRPCLPGRKLARDSLS